VSLAGVLPTARALPPVYAITDRAAAGGLSHAEIARRLFGVGVRLLQVREKEMPDRLLIEEVEECGRLAREAGAILVVNDRADVARLAGTGVHVGDEDLPAVDAARLTMPGALLGVSTHSLEEARAAFAAPEPDYVAFGPVLASSTKTVREARGLDALAQVASLPGRAKPLVAIGGIEAADVGRVLQAGADCVAAVSAFCRGGRIEENARAFLDAARRARRPGRVYLIGFMACGKTTVGRRVAERLDVPFVDLDEEIERTSGKTIRALFEAEGEAAFREREAAFLAATEALPYAVVATGGGCYVRDDNRQRISRLGTAVLLDVELPVLLARLSGKTDRPLFRGGEQAAALWAERLPFYRMGSVTVKPGDGSVEESADRVLIALDARVRPAPAG
jgi:thiamine-phosphate diphosphorylase